MKPVRVSKSNPCPICHKTDWCMIGTDTVFCMRVAGSKSTQFADGSVAFLHPTGERSHWEYRKPEPERPHINCQAIMNMWMCGYPKSNGVLAAALGVSEQSLNDLWCCRSPYPGTWAFPMRVGDNTMVGIRLRHLDGKKWAERGSRQGLFIPQRDTTDTVMVCEGPTDTAAALTIGYFAIGRPSCNGGLGDMIACLKRIKAKRVIIVADCDQDRKRDNGGVYNPGIDGAVALSDVIGIKNVVLTLPAKDMRQFVNNGGTASMIEALVQQMVWRTF